MTMKTLKIISVLAFVFFLASCSSTIKFPTSGVTPAADITAKKKDDRNGNYEVTVIAKNLASADRLDPPKSIYVTWIVTHTQGIKNLGRLTNKNSKTATLKALTPFSFSEIFITAEGEADISYPRGAEITRARFND